MKEAIPSGSTRMASAYPDTCSSWGRSLDHTAPAGSTSHRKNVSTTSAGPRVVSRRTSCDQSPKIVARLSNVGRNASLTPCASSAAFSIRPLKSDVSVTSWTHGRAARPSTNARRSTGQPVDEAADQSTPGHSRKLRTMLRPARAYSLRSATRITLGRAAPCLFRFLM